MDDHQKAESGAEFKITPGDRDPGAYPSTHEWGMFAGLAVELGGYHDVELVDPYTGDRFWYQPADYQARAASGEDFDLLAVLIEALTEARKQGWGATPDPEIAGTD